MVGTPSSAPSEGLKAARLCMVLGSISPLFIFWAIQGSSFHRRRLAPRVLRIHGHCPERCSGVATVHHLVRERRKVKMR